MDRVHLCITIFFLEFLFFGSPVMGENHPMALRIQVNIDGRVPFDPQTHGFAHITFYNAVLGRLLILTKSNTIEPNLLSSAAWDFSKNAYVLRLRDNLRFHNGRPVSIQDLEYSLVRFFLAVGRADPVAFLRNIEGISNLSPGQSFQSGDVTGIKILDSQSLSVKLTQPNPSFLFLLGDSWISLVPREELNIDHVTWKHVPVGAGPYKVSKIDRGFVQLVASDKNMQPKLVEFSGMIGDKKLDLAAYSYDNPDPKRLVPVILDETLGMSGLFFNYTTPIGSDLQFRRAISSLINREDLINGEIGLSPLHEMLTSNFLGRLEFSTPKEWANKDSLQKLKLRYSGVTIKFATHREGTIPSKLEEKAIEKISDILKSIGFTVLKVAAKSTTFNDNEKDISLRFDHRGTAFLDPLIILNAYAGKGLLVKYMPSENSNYLKLLDEATAAISSDVKFQTIKSISSYVFQNSFIVPLYERKKIVYLNRDRIKNLGYQPGIGINLQNITFMEENK